MKCENPFPNWKPITKISYIELDIIVSKLVNNFQESCFSLPDPWMPTIIVKVKDEGTNLVVDGSNRLLGMSSLMGQKGLENFLVGL